MKERKLKAQTKSIANAVGVAAHSDPQCNKSNANVVGADDSVCPQPMRTTQTKSPTKVSSNLNSHISHLTSDHNGITLIALIISIIIMIILVAVTVNIAINGNLFGTTKDAAYGTEKAAMLEQMQSEIVAKYAKGQASITKGELVGVLEKYGVVTYDEDDEITGIVTEKGYEIPIEEIWLIRTEERPEEPPVQEPEPTPPEPTDTESPTVQVATITTSPTNASSITYTITFSEDVTGFTKEDITVENGTAATLSGSGRIYTVEVTNSGSGTQKVSIGANVCTDGAGNGNEASNVVSIVIDRENPTVGISPNGGYYVMPTGEGETAKVSATLTAEKTGGSLVAMQYAWSESNTEEPTSGWETFTNNQTVEKTGIASPSTWYLWTKVIDGVGNRGEVTSGKYVSNAYIIGANNVAENMIKLTPNSTPATLESSNGYTGEDVVVEVSFGANLSGEKTLSCTGTEGEDYEINGTQVATQEINGLGINGTMSITVKTNNQTVTASAKDVGGNTSVATIKITHIDKTPAVISSALGVTESEETAGLVTFSLTAEDLESGLDNITWYYQSTEEGSQEESIPRTVTTNKTASNVAYTREVQLTEGTTYNCYAVVTNMVGNTIRVPAGTETVEITTSEADDWSWLSKMAVEISKDGNIPGADVAEEPVMQVTKTIDGTEHTLNIGDEFDIEYDGNPNKVRIIGFKHDKLTDNAKTGDYSGQTYAGITFDFVYCMTSNFYVMNSSDTNLGGWAATELRQTLNGYTTTAESQSGSIGGLGANLSNKKYIKQVQKIYGPQYDSAETSTCEDYLWALSYSEIWSSGFRSGCMGFSVGLEGIQYAYFNSNENGISYRSGNTNFNKLDPKYSVSRVWWLRSTVVGADSSFGACSGGSAYANSATTQYYLAPSFCI